MTQTAARLEIPTPRWFLPLLEPKRYKGAKGGRSAGKSHAFAELMVEEAVAHPDMFFVCIREVQKSLKFSAKRTIEQKIRSLGVEHLFDSTTNEIRRRGGQGVILFQGMQDHTADSIRSLEGFHRAWVEEAHSLSRVSLGMLLPTIREEGSEIWFSWNPHYPTDPVDRLMAGDQFDAEQTTTVHVTYRDNPFITEQALAEAERHRRYQPDTFNHVWLGEYVEISEALIFSGHWRIAEFEPGADWDGPYHGLDFGFANDPTAAVRCWVHEDRLFIEREGGGVKIELDDTAAHLKQAIPGIDKHVIRADSARPESISYLQRHGLPKVRGVKKGAGSVDDGIAHLKSYREIVVHPRCEDTADELRRYSYKVDKRSGDVLPVVVDAFNHYIDACIERGQLVSTVRGLVPIERVRSGDRVHTRKGPREVLVSRMTHESAPIYELETASGRVLRATPDHRVHVSGKGFVRMDAIRYNDRVISLESRPCRNQSRSNMADILGAVIPNHAVARIVNISGVGVRAASRSSCIAKCGRIISGLYLKAVTFTTRTRISRTTIRRTWNACRLRNTEPSILLGAAGLEKCDDILLESGPSARAGIPHQRVERNTVRSVPSRTRTSARNRSGVRTAPQSFSPATLEARIVSVLLHARRLIGARPESMMSNDHASSVESLSPSTSIGKPDFVPDRVVRVRATGENSPVYDLMVEDAEEFFSSGILVHNCRYALEPLIRTRNRPRVRAI